MKEGSIPGFTAQTEEDRLCSPQAGMENCELWDKVCVIIHGGASSGFWTYALS